MPYPNEHSCRLHDPEGYEEGSFRRIRRGDLAIIIGRRKGKGTTEAQAYRYPVKEWTEKTARAHCKEEGGRFEAASKEEKAMNEQELGTTNEGLEDAIFPPMQTGEILIDVDGVEVGVEELVVAYKAQQERVQRQEERPSTALAGKTMGDDLVITFGDAVKAVSVDQQKVRIGGYLLRFGMPDEVDLTGTDFFAADTYYGPTDGNGADTMVNHGIPLRTGLEGLADRILAPLKTKRDEIGIWAETVLDLADEYERVIHEMVRAGKLKWSSGTAARLARRQPSGKISRWPIIEGSLTPRPMEPRLPAVMPLRAYLGLLTEPDSGGDGAGLELPEGLEPAEPEQRGDGAGAPCAEALEVLARAEMVLVEIENTDGQD